MASPPEIPTIDIVVSAAVKQRMDALGESAQQFACVPLLSDRAAAEFTGSIGADAVESYCIIYRRWLSAPEGTICVRLTDDSMAPTLNAGSIVAANRSRRGPGGLNGKIVAVLRSERGGILIRRVVMDGQHLSFTPENPAYDATTGEPRHPTIIVERRPHRGVPAPANPIVGKIDWAWSLFP